MVGVYAPGRAVAPLGHVALHALQHRGQESAGIAVTSPDAPIERRRGLGLVDQALGSHDLDSLRGDAAIGHVRYSTTGATSLGNAQPIVRSDLRTVALAHNGNLIRTTAARAELARRGVSLTTTSDSEIIAALIATDDTPVIEDAIEHVIELLEGAFSVVVLTSDALVAFRDQRGVRPLSLGRLPGGWCVASETCALDALDVHDQRDVRPGEVVTISSRGLKTRLAGPPGPGALCVFEHIYFSRSDSRLGGVVLHLARQRMGELLWQEAPVNADLVVSVPESGNAAAGGLARASGIPRDDGLLRSRYVARTFIQPGSELRQRGVRMKFTPVRELIAGKRLVVVDDSIVRGTTMQEVVRMLRDAGAAEIHLRISSPPIRQGCHYGIDMATQEELIASDRTTDEVADLLGVDSLHHLSLESVYKAIRGSGTRHCDACFTGRDRVTDGAPAPLAGIAAG